MQEDRKNESGRSMVEMLGVLSIMGVIMYGAIAGINFGIDMYKINATHTEIEEMAQAIVDLYSWTQNFDGLQGTDGDFLIANKIVCMNDAHPGCTKIAEGGYTITNQWGGDVYAEAIDCGNNGDCGSFDIVYEDVPRLACQRLIHDLEFKNVRTPSGDEIQCDGESGSPDTDGCCPKTTMKFHLQ